MPEQNPCWVRGDAFHHVVRNYSHIDMESLLSEEEADVGGLVDSMEGR